MTDEIVGWWAGLGDLLARFAHRFERMEPRRQALSYLVGLSSPLLSKNGWTWQRPPVTGVEVPQLR
ncbi:hypothetical protein [Micromonospora sp. KC213]|uniref:hypothetical protein n=1 Tax=Micromonospora sp. KC213 TaxID=2530378 RepID=UPI001042C4F7|nr:hypothetical protein [Micromonospora sp. KC213]TDC43467.1 hypothetical protein E1166_03315 [Micromonospora sp. KC213]